MKIILIPVLMCIIVLSLVSYTDTNAVLMSPLKQIKSGILVQDVKCGEGFVLVIKLENNNPACVKPDSVTRLLAHGWLTIEKFQTNHTTVLPQNEANIISNHVNTINTTGTISNSNIHNQTQNGTNDTVSLINNTTNITNPPVSTIGSNMRNVSGPTILLSPRITTPIISATKLDIKIMSITMSPDPLKIGDKPQFIVTYQNISDKKIVHMDAPCPVFTYTISPPDSVSQSQKDGMRGCESMGRDVIFYFIEPNQISTDEVYPPSTAGLFTLIKAGVLTVTMSLSISVDNGDRYIETVQFNINATQ